MLLAPHARRLPISPSKFPRQDPRYRLRRRQLPHRRPRSRLERLRHRTQSRRSPRPQIAVVSTIGDAQQFAPFDCITLWHSLEHFLDPRQALLDLHPLLAPNGTLLIAVPNAYGSQARLFGTNWLALDVPRHLHHFSSQSLQLLLTQTGFKPSRLWHHEAEYDIFGWMQSVINKVHHKPNVLFDLLTGRKLQLSPLARTTQLLAGALLFTPAFILTVITTWLQVGGTLLQSSKPVR